MQVRFRLNHLYQGQNSPFLHAVDAGLFAREGIEIAFLEGFSSSQVTRALEGGEVELGFGDMPSVLESAIRTKSSPIACLMPIFVRSPSCLGYRHRQNALTLADLDGAILCGPKGDTSARLLPLLLRRNGLADIDYTLLEVTPEERDRLVANNEVLAATCFDATLKFAMRMRGHNSDDLEFLYFADHGLDVYSSALLCREDLLAANPGLEATLRTIIRRAWDECRDDPERGVRAVLARTPGFDPAIAREQLDWVLTHQVYPGNQPPMQFISNSQRMATTLDLAELAVTGLELATAETRSLALKICRDGADIG